METFIKFQHQISRKYFLVMIKLLKKYRSLIVAIFVLAPLLFWFSYSELGQLVGEKEIPTQDYCEIIKITKAETGKVSISDLFKLKVDKSISLPYVDETYIQITSFTKLDIEHFRSPQKTTEIYLFNRSFLI
jgi:hypothetical protein